MCHVAPSTFGYLPLATTAIGGTVHLKHPPAQIISPWIDPRTCQINNSRRTATTQVSFVHIHNHKFVPTQCFYSHNLSCILSLISIEGESSNSNNSNNHHHIVNICIMLLYTIDQFSCNHKRMAKEKVYRI